MGEMRVNFAEIEVGSFEPVPEGRYNCVVEDVTVRESKSSDYDYLNWELRIVDEEYEDKRLWMISSLSPKAGFKLKELFMELELIDGEEEDFPLEWDDDVDITPKEGPQVTAPDVIGLEVVAVVENEMYKGKEQNRVEQLLPGGSETEAEEPEEKPAKKARGKAKKAGRRKLR